jgi:hypothetical protein
MCNLLTDKYFYYYAVCRSLDSTLNVKRPLEDLDDIPDELKKQKNDPDAPEQDDTKYENQQIIILIASRKWCESHFLAAKTTV